MKKKMGILCIALTMTILSVTAFAYSQYAAANIVHESTRLSFEGYMTTNATPGLVRHIQVNMYAYNYMTGAVYYNDSNVGNGQNSIMAVESIYNPSSGWYCNEVTGLVQYDRDPTRYIEDAYDEYKLGIYRMASTDSIESKHRDVRNEMLMSFGYDPQDYKYYLNKDITEALPCDAYFDIRQQLALAVGDSIPGYYLNNAHDVLIAVKKDANDVNYKFVFEQDGSGSWELTETEYN